MTEFSVRGSNVVVVGAGRSGVGAARLLAGRGARVTLTEMRSDVGEEVERLREVGVDLELGGHRPETYNPRHTSKMPFDWAAPSTRR